MIGARFISTVLLSLLLAAWIGWPQPPAHATRRTSAGAKGAPPQARDAMRRDLERELADAAALYRQGRVSASFGKFLGLANRGNADAAHIALFMSRYGVALYDTHWETYPEDIEDWAQLIADRDGKHLPVFIPDPYDLKPAAKPSPQVMAAARTFRQGRFGEAFAAFSQLASRGDPDAAHIALFMDKYGPLLFGSYWGADAQEAAGWRRLVAHPAPGKPAARMPL
jgi:hypothetical protein